MRDFPKLRAASIAAFALVGLALVAALLLLAAQKGETQGGKKAGEAMRLAKVTVRWTQDINYKRSEFLPWWLGTGISRETFDATIVMEVPAFGYWEAKNIKWFKLGLEEDGLELRSETVDGVETVEPVRGRLVSFTLASSYFEEGRTEYKEACQGRGAIMTFTTQGGGTSQPQPGSPADRWFQITFKDGKLATVGAQGHEHTVTTQETKSPDPGAECKGDKTFQFSETSIHPGKVTHLDLGDWSVQETRTRTRYSVTGRYSKHSTESPFPQGLEDTTVARTLSFTFDLEPQELEAVMWVEDSASGKKYDEWLPLGALDETQRGDLATVHVKLHVKDKPKAEVHEKATFRFELEDVSSEPGVAMNWPPKDKVKSTPDLAIEDQYNPTLKVETAWETAGGKAGPRAKTKKKDIKAEVRISTFDYGAWGTLKVYADLESGGPALVAHLKEKPDVKELKLPRDDDNNHIADAWEKMMGLKGVAAESDDDFIPKGDGTKGDGLSVYEEYRGFMVLIQGMEQHKRTNPKKKTLFIVDEVGARPGIDLFRSASGLEVYEIPDEGMDSAHIVNFNHKTAHAVDQHGLWLTMGWADDWGGRSPIGPPRFVDKVEIASNFPDTVAHELGHAVGMPHHGSRDYECGKKPDCRNQIPSPQWHYRVAVQQGQTSGGFECIMRYRWANLIERMEGGQIKYSPYGDAEASTNFCRTDRGTKRNTKTGDATPGCGNNLGYIRISDKYDSPRPEHQRRGCL